jgi:hypothetical protein
MERRLLAAMCCCLVARLVGGHREHKVSVLLLVERNHLDLRAEKCICVYSLSPFYTEDLERSHMDGDHDCT